MGENNSPMKCTLVVILNRVSCHLRRNVPYLTNQNDENISKNKGKYIKYIEIKALWEVSDYELTVTDVSKDRVVLRNISKSSALNVAKHSGSLGSLSTAL